jgi:glucose/mannose transport system substrate-binding protein
MRVPAGSTRRTLLRWLSTATPLLAGGLTTSCGDDAESEEETGTDQLEIFSWWTSASEGAALGQLLDAFKSEHAGVTITNTAADASLDARQELTRRMSEGLPPDLFQVSGGNGVAAWVTPSGGGTENSAVESLESLAADGSWKAAIPPALLEVVTFEGTIYAVPVNVHRINCLFYNKKVFDDLGLTPPSTIEAFVEVAEVIRAAGITPLALGLKDKWVLGTTIWENLIPAIAGADYYNQYLTGKKDPADPVMRAALEEVGRLFDHIDIDARTMGWTDAVARVASGAAAMNFMGDWAKGEFVAAGLAADVDFGVVNWGADVFVFTTDAFVLPKGAANHDNALHLAAIMGSVAGQDAFNPAKGSIPARIDIDATKYDAISRAAIAAFASPATTLLQATALMVPNDFADPVIEAFSSFAEDRNVDNVLQTMVNYYDVLQR